MIQTIGIGEVLSEMCQPSNVFTIEYRKVDGNYGKKERCVLVRGSNNDLSERKKMNRNGLLLLREVGGKHDFSVYIDLLVSFNGTEIDFHK
ncbi:hypothetical protein GCM10011514_06510 [Emticicia aquatilis]|uniref:Uncharacterized protein n=1 Tax=Emticicia aquatilis TaxID=1537369 RepID=A0A917DL67_9BACT|nr:hypothetical protein [Emticicia aquatilis]GGD45157.1 hypothetical protein GCM10011514_06510 [Emticicia aquatilis]